jgi:5-methylcytosine-specific restriction endonuclease McrA
MVEMNYQSLVAVLRAMMSEEGLCLGCGHTFLGERDIHIEHLEPPRFPHDWARLHTRNCRLFCASCNTSKGKKPFADWLDIEEERRLSNRAQPASQQLRQPGLFD